MPQKPFTFGTLFDAGELFNTIKSINKAFDDFSDQKIWNIGNKESSWTQAWKLPFRAIASLALKIPKYIAMVGLFAVGSITAGILGGFKDVLVGMSKAVRGENGGLKTAGLGVLKILGGTVVAGCIGIAIASGVGVPVIAAIAPIAVSAGTAIASAGTAIASAMSAIPAMVTAAPLLSSLVIAPVAVGILMGMRKLLQIGKFTQKNKETEIKSDASLPNSPQSQSELSRLAKFEKATFAKQQEERQKTSSPKPHTPSANKTPFPPNTNQPTTANRTTKPK